MASASLIADINAAAAPTYGAIDDLLLDALRVPPRTRQRLVQAGVLLKVGPRSYLTGPIARNPSFDALCAVGQMIGGPDSRLSHTTSARILGLWDRGTPHVHVVVPRAIGPIEDHRFTFHHVDTPYLFDEPLAVAGHRLTAVSVMCFMLGAIMTPYELAAVLRRASDLHLLDQRLLKALVDDRRGHRGAAIVRIAIEMHENCGGGSRSASEDCYLARSARLGLPTPIVNTKGSVGIPGYEPDIVYERWRTIVHIDGGGHDRPGVRQQDALEDEQLRHDGWAIVRGSSRDPWRRDDRMVHQVKAVLEARGWNGTDGVPSLHDPERRALLRWLSRRR